MTLQDDPREIIRRRSLPKARSTECVGPLVVAAAAGHCAVRCGGVDILHPLLTGNALRIYLFSIIYEL